MSVPIYKSEEFVAVVIGLLAEAAKAGGVPANLPTNPEAESLVKVVEDIVAAKGNFAVIVTTLLSAASTIYSIVQKIEGEVNPPAKPEA